ncbi:MAG: 4-hydroxy-3-methylbut-2-enyl diphosphate reductase [Chloroflexota bacterium]
MKIEKAARTGFCFGVRRAVSLLERVAQERGGVETLGEVVHNTQVLRKLAGSGVSIARRIPDIRGEVVVTSSHGVTPEVEEQIRARRIGIISTTCPFVRRAQLAARRLADADFRVVVFGDADHPEVKGILGWARGTGIATRDVKAVAALDPMPRRIGVLSQTTQIPAQFVEFAREIIAAALKKDSEIRIIDTICHDIRERQETAQELAERVDLMLVIGGHNSANTRHLAELCARVTETHHVASAEEIRPRWLRGKKSVGVTGGASTPEDTVSEVLEQLTGMS